VLARAAVDAGIDTVAATPHLRADFPDVHPEELADRCRVLRAAMAQHEIPLRVVSGAETSLVWALQCDRQQLALATYAQHAESILIETPNDVTGIQELLYVLRAQGLRVILAHPERSSGFHASPDHLEALCCQGVVPQVDAGSLVHRPDSSVRRLAERVVSSGHPAVIASDAHRGQSWRPVTILAQAASAAATLVGPARAAWMTSEAPLAIVEGRELPDAPPSRPARRSWWKAGRGRPVRAA